MRGGSRGSTLELDGQPIPGVRAFTIECGVGKATTVTLEMIALDVEFEGDVYPKFVTVRPNSSPTKTVYDLDGDEVRVVEVTSLESENREWKIVDEP